MRKIRHHNFYFSRRWPTLVPGIIYGWSAGKLTFSIGAYCLGFCACLSLHFYEKDKPVNAYWVDA